MVPALIATLIFFPCSFRVVAFSTNDAHAEGHGELGPMDAQLSHLEGDLRQLWTADNLEEEDDGGMPAKSAHAPCQNSIAAASFEGDSDKDWPNGYREKSEICVDSFKELSKISTTMPALIHPLVPLVEGEAQPPRTFMTNLVNGALTKGKNPTLKDMMVVGSHDAQSYPSSYNSKELRSFDDGNKKPIKAGVDHSYNVSENLQISTRHSVPCCCLENDQEGETNVYSYNFRSTNFNSSANLKSLASGFDPISAFDKGVAHDIDFYAQLEAGVRFFDIRLTMIANSGSNLFARVATHHGLRNVNIFTIMYMIYMWARCRSDPDHAHEVIQVRLKWEGAGYKTLSQRDRKDVIEDIFEAVRIEPAIHSNRYCDSRYFRWSWADRHILKGTRTIEKKTGGKTSVGNLMMKTSGEKELNYLDIPITEMKDHREKTADPDRLRTTREKQNKLINISNMGLPPGRSPKRADEDPILKELDEEVDEDQKLNRPTVVLLAGEDLIKMIWKYGTEHMTRDEETCTRLETELCSKRILEIKQFLLSVLHTEIKGGKSPEGCCNAYTNVKDQLEKKKKPTTLYWTLTFISAKASSAFKTAMKTGANLAMGTTDYTSLYSVTLNKVPKALCALWGAINAPPKWGAKPWTPTPLKCGQQNDGTGIFDGVNLVMADFPNRLPIVGLAYAETACRLGLVDQERYTAMVKEACTGVTWTKSEKS